MTSPSSQILFRASISGGDFWHGFGAAATTGLMNHVLHNSGGTDPEERVNMSKASDQEIIDQFAYTLKRAKMNFEANNQYMPIDLREYFTGFPVTQGQHLIVDGELCGIRVQLELPLHVKNNLNWGGPSWTSYSNFSGERWAFFQYSKFNSTRYPLWGIGFPAKYESSARNIIPGL